MLYERKGDRDIYGAGQTNRQTAGGHTDELGVLVRHVVWRALGVSQELLEREWAFGWVFILICCRLAARIDVSAPVRRDDCCIFPAQLRTRDSGRRCIHAGDAPLSHHVPQRKPSHACTPLVSVVMQSRGSFSCNMCI